MAILSTVTLLDDLKQLGLGDPLFMEELHHLGGTMNGFRNHAANKTFFQRDPVADQLLHDRLATSEPGAIMVRSVVERP